MTATTITTAQAAASAGVTADTIRTWARMGAVEAVRTGRRWAISAASLLHRIALGNEMVKARRERALAAKAKKAITAEQMVAIGGREWTKAGHHRVYVNDIAGLLGLEVSYYRTGNISSASLDGEGGISNAEAGRLLGAVDKVWFDAADGKLHLRWGYSDPRTLTRDDIKERIFGGIRARIAAL